MIPRSSACILLDMERAKEDFDHTCFDGHTLTASRKTFLLFAWYAFNRQLVPLMHELEAARNVESKARITRMLQVAARPAWFE